MRRMHPDGMARLIAVVVAPGDVEAVGLKGSRTAYQRAVEYRMEQVLKLARTYYRHHEQDFVDATGWKAQAPKNGLKNLAKLDRRNLLVQA